MVNKDKQSINMTELLKSLSGFAIVGLQQVRLLDSKPATGREYAGFKQA
jgi:hypothetical protein